MRYSGELPDEVAAISSLSRIKALWAPLAAFAATLGLELALVERKYAIFAGGFGSSHVIDRPGELGLFLAGLLISHALVIAIVYLVMRALHGRRRDTPLFLLDFLFATLAFVAAALAVKYEVLSYFSDAIGFELIRKLGGGSLFDALLFVLDEAGLLAIGAAGAAIAYTACLWLVRRHAPPRIATGALKWRHLLWLALPLPLVLLAANRDGDVRYALTRFNAYGLANAALGAATDFDRDGYSWFSARPDGFPFDSARHPLALDIPDNGIDEDGLGGDFHFAGPPPTQGIARLPATARNLVLIVLESTRGDAIGRHVDGRPVTPVLNALARSGSYQAEAYSHVGFTTESLKSLFSGKLHPAMGTESLFRDLKANGYRIGVFSGQPESFGDIAPVVGMKESADIFADADTLKAERAFGFAAQGSLLVDGRKLLREFDRSFGRREDWRQPTFLYFNFQEAHFPYHHPGMLQRLPGTPIPRGEIGADTQPWVARTYWNAVAYDDWLIGSVIARLKRLGVWENSLLVVTADHGESLFDDGFLGHGHVINRQQTRIPLILSVPGIAIPAPIGLADYRPLLLRALGAKGIAERPAGPVFQHIGDLNWPTAIGLVGAGGVWTTLQLETEEAWFSDGNRRLRYGDLAAGSLERRRVDRVIDEWARQRWLAHLAAR